MRGALICLYSSVAVMSAALGTASIVSAQIAAPDFVSPAEPQEREFFNGAQPDLVSPAEPQEHEFFNGAQPTNPAFEKTVPRVPQHRAYLPPSVDLSSTMPPVGDQGRSMSCSAWSIAYAARSYYARSLEGRRTDLPANVASPSYVFHLAREGDHGCVEGTNIRRVVEVLRRGALSIAEYPFSPACRAPASPQQIARAKDFRVKSFKGVNVASIEDIKGQLSERHPVIMRFHDSVSFQRHRGPGTFSESLDDPKAVAVGWHAFTLVGYDDKRQAFRLINSWGTKWGDNGYAWISYETLRARSSSAYVIQVETPGMPMASREPRRSSPSIFHPSDTPPSIGRSLTSDDITPVSTRDAGAQLSDLDKLVCAKVTAAEAGDRHVISGFVSSAADLNRVKAIATKVPGTALGDVSVVPWPRCELMLTLEKSLAATDRPKVAPGRPAMLSTLGGPRYLYVSLIRRDGSVNHLLQPESAAPKATPAGQTLPLANASRGILVALASTAPLFEKPLAPNQTDREYLSAVRHAMFDETREVSATVEALP